MRVDLLVTVEWICSSPLIHLLQWYVSITQVSLHALFMCLAKMFAADCLWHLLSYMVAFESMLDYSAVFTYSSLSLWFVLPDKHSLYMPCCLVPKHVWALSLNTCMHDWNSQTWSSWCDCCLLQVHLIPTDRRTLNSMGCVNLILHCDTQGCRDSNSAGSLTEMWSQERLKKTNLLMVTSHECMSA